MMKFIYSERYRHLERDLLVAGAYLLGKKPNRAQVAKRLGLKPTYVSQITGNFLYNMNRDLPEILTSPHNIPTRKILSSNDKSLRLEIKEYIKSLTGKYSMRPSAKRSLSMATPVKVLKLNWFQRFIARKILRIKI